VYDEPRTASIVAINYCHCYALDREAFETIACAFPEWWDGMMRKGSLLSRGGNK